MCGGVRGRIEVASFANQPPTGAKLPRPASHKIVQARWEHRDIAPYLRLAVPNYPRRQQYRRLVHAGEAALGSAIGALFGLLTASTGAAALAGLLLLAAVGMGLYARHWLSLAGRSRVGAGRRMRFGVRSLRSRRRGGGCGTRCRGKGAETSTRSRSRRPASRSRSFSAPVLVVVSALRRAICSGGPRVLCPGVRPPGLLQLRGVIQSSAGGVAGRSGVLDGA